MPCQDRMLSATTLGRRDHRLLLLFLTFSVLVANSKEIIYTMMWPFPLVVCCSALLITLNHTINTVQ